MHIDQQPYRELYERLHETDAPAIVLLDAWLRENVEQVAWLKRFEEAYGPTSATPIEDRWRLYALSRVVQLLTLRFQPGDDDGSPWPGPDISVDQWSSFAERLGLSVTQPESSPHL